MKEDKAEKKMAAGCFVVAAIFFMMLAIYQCSAEQREQQAKQPAAIRQSTPIQQETTPIHHKKRTAIGIPASDDESNADLYDNPDFDDLIPGDEYDEEFVDRDEGDPELYE